MVAVRVDDIVRAAMACQIGPQTRGKGVVPAWHGNPEAPHRDAVDHRDGGQSAVTLLCQHLHMVPAGGAMTGKLGDVCLHATSVRGIARCNVSDFHIRFLSTAQQAVPTALPPTACCTGMEGYGPGIPDSAPPWRTNPGYPHSVPRATAPPARWHPAASRC